MNEFPDKPPETSQAKELLTQSLAELLCTLTALLKVKSLITFAIIGVLSYLAIIKAVGPETFMAVASAVVTYYFTRKE